MGEYSSSYPPPWVGYSRYFLYLWTYLIIFITFLRQIRYQKLLSPIVLTLHSLKDSPQMILIALMLTSNIGARILE